MKKIGLTAVVIAAFGALLLGWSSFRGSSSPLTVIVQAEDTAAAGTAVLDVGGTVNRELGIIDAVSGKVTPRQLNALRAREGLRVWRDQPVKASASDSVYPGHVNVDPLHSDGLTGAGVTVAVVDSGIKVHHNLAGPIFDAETRLLAQYNAFTGEQYTQLTSDDARGHGSHVSSMILSGVTETDFTRNGVAPDADFVSVKVLDGNGMGTYTSVIDGIDWVVANKSTYGIRVMNLSLAAEPRSYYFDDPFNQAVMRAWQAGIVVVVSAGNFGPDPMTIGVPGNVPYVITVGAWTDAYTKDDPSDDYVPPFSSRGPTNAAFIKPEVLGVGGHADGFMAALQDLPMAHPEFFNPFRSYLHFKMSGTSQAAATVTGVVAVLLQAEPALTPDEVKCRLIASARPSLDENGNLSPSIFHQGAGLVDAVGAVNSTASGCANVGLDIAKDLSGEEHYMGSAEYDPSTGTFSGGGSLWDGGSPFDVGSPFDNTSPFDTAFPFDSGAPFDTGGPWDSTHPWDSGGPWDASMWNIDRSPWDSGNPFDSSTSLDAYAAGDNTWVGNDH